MAKARNTPRPFSLRHLCVRLHRYVGLTLAFFLVIAGLTGSVLVWHDELEAVLAPELFTTENEGEVLSVHQLMESFETQVPGGALSYIRLPKAPGQTAQAYIAKWPHDVPASQAFLDPVTGQLLGIRDSFNPRLNRAEIIPWIYKLHYSLTLGRIGTLILGIISLLWFIDSFIGWILTLPRGGFSWAKWKKAWGIKRKRLNFDMHRAIGLWLFPVLAMLAFTSVSFNLYSQLFIPALNVVSEVTKRPYHNPPLETPLIHPAADWDEAIATASAELTVRQIPHTLSFAGYYPSGGYYWLGFDTPQNLSTDRSGGEVYVSGSSGDIMQVHITGQGTAADTILQWQLPLHSGRAFGLPGRLIIFLAGILTVLLSITGVVIWWRKYKARRQSCRGRKLSCRHTAT